jgi:hypothetical protein
LLLGGPDLTLLPCSQHRIGPAHKGRGAGEGRPCSSSLDLPDPFCLTPRPRTDPPQLVPYGRLRSPPTLLASPSSLHLPTWNTLSASLPSSRVQLFSTWPTAHSVSLRRLDAPLRERRLRLTRPPPSARHHLRGLGHVAALRPQRRLPRGEFSTIARYEHAPLTTACDACRSDGRSAPPPSEDTLGVVSAIIWAITLSALADLGFCRSAGTTLTSSTVPPSSVPLVKYSLVALHFGTEQGQPPSPLPPLQDVSDHITPLSPHLQARAAALPSSSPSSRARKSQAAAEPSRTLTLATLSDRLTSRLAKIGSATRR